MIYKCQRDPTYHIHTVEAPDEATARVMMYNRSNSRDWLDHGKTLVWSDEDWTAL
jgi:hypothetical protein